MYGYRLWIPSLRKIVLMRSVLFYLSPPASSSSPPSDSTCCPSGSSLLLLHYHVSSQFASAPRCASLSSPKPCAHPLSHMETCDISPACSSVTSVFGTIIDATSTSRDRTLHRHSARLQAQVHPPSAYSPSSPLFLLRRSSQLHALSTPAHCALVSTVSSRPPLSPPPASPTHRLSWPDPFNQAASSPVVMKTSLLLNTHRSYTEAVSANIFDLWQPDRANEHLSLLRNNNSSRVPRQPDMHVLPCMYISTSNLAGTNNPSYRWDPARSSVRIVMRRTPRLPSMLL